MMPDKMKSILIGLFVIIAIVSTVYIILFLEPTIGDGGKTLRVRFANISGINVGTRVNVSGKPVGEVTVIDEVKGARQNPSNELGRIYFYQLELKVDSSVTVFNTDEVTIATTGLMGEKSIAIIPKVPPKGIIAKNITKEIIYAQSIEPLENVIVQITTLAEKLESTIGDFDVWFVENQEELGDSVRFFADTMKQLDQMIGSINNEQIISSAKQAIDNFSKNMKLIQNNLEEIEDNEMLAKFNVILENFAEASDYINSDGTQILTNVNKITQDIAEGKGSLGKFIKNDDFYLRTVSIMSKVDTLMNDINHYGILFQYDKHWQRIRTKRANLLECLDKPKEFKEYFETEVDTVTTALSRISVLLEKTKEPKEKEKILQSIPFQKDFSSLLRQVEHLLDSLKLYNEQVIETISEDN
jgi:phospholipid/cholesterol/gamma-HCH transport system substrate-binding protein